MPAFAHPWRTRCFGAAFDCVQSGETSQADEWVLRLGETRTRRGRPGRDKGRLRFPAGGPNRFAHARSAAVRLLPKQSVHHLDEQTPDGLLIAVD